MKSKFNGFGFGEFLVLVAFLILAGIVIGAVAGPIVYTGVTLAQTNISVDSNAIHATHASGWTFLDWMLK